MATLKLIFGLALVAALGLVGFKVIPPYFANYELEDAIKTESVQAMYSTRVVDIRIANIASVPSAPQRPFSNCITSMARRCRPACRAAA